MRVVLITGLLFLFRLFQAINELLLEFAVLLELLFELFVGGWGLDAELEVTGACGVTEWWAIIACLEVVGDEVAGVGSQQCQFEVPGS